MNVFPPPPAVLLCLLDSQTHTCSHPLTCGSLVIDGTFAPPFSFFFNFQRCRMIIQAENVSSEWCTELACGSRQFREVCCSDWCTRRRACTASRSRAEEQDDWMKVTCWTLRLTWQLLRPINGVSFHQMRLLVCAVEFPWQHVSQCQENEPDFKCCFWITCWHFKVQPAVETQQFRFLFIYFNMAAWMDCIKGMLGKCKLFISVKS